MNKFVRLFVVFCLTVCLTSCANGETTATKDSTKKTTTTERVFEVITADSNNTTTTDIQSDTTTASDSKGTSSSLSKTTTTTKQQTTVKTNKKTTTTTPKKNTTPTTTTKFVPVVDSFFNDAIFVGDSVSLKLKLYVATQMSKGVYPLGHATFFTAGSLGWNNSLWDTSRSDSVHPVLYGRKMKIADAVVATKSKKVFLMLGINDLGPYGVDGAYSTAVKVINDIKAKSPDTVIYIQSVTPIASGCENGRINNSNIKKLNEKFKALCTQNGYIYLDIWSLMGGDTLKREYCSDPNGMGIHFTNTACKKWIEYLSNSLNTQPKPPQVITTTKPTTTTKKTTTPKPTTTTPVQTTTTVITTTTNPETSSVVATTTIPEITTEIDTTTTIDTQTE